MSSSRYCLIGHPLGHSLSPFIHTRLFAVSGKTTDGYTLNDILPDRLDEDFPSLLQTVNGCNVTIPFKQRVLPHLDRLEGKAALYQTVNTVAVTDNGTVGYNTDADGFLRALQAAQIPLAGRVLLLGAGGAGTVLACEAALAGCEIVIYNPFDHCMAYTLRDRIALVAPDAICTVSETIPQGSFDLLLNSTPVGMYPNVDECAAPENVIAASKAVFDAVYNPRETVLLQKAKANGAKTAGGMAMLVWQAAIAHEHWYGARFNNDAIQEIIEDCYKELASQF